MNRYKSKPDADREFEELDFGIIPQKLQEEDKITQHIA